MSMIDQTRNGLGSCPAGRDARVGGWWSDGGMVDWIGYAEDKEIIENRKQGKRVERSRAAE